MSKEEEHPAENVQPKYEDWWKGIPPIVHGRFYRVSRDAFERAARLRGQERERAYHEMVETIAPVLIEYGRRLERSESK